MKKYINTVPATNQMINSSVVSFLGNKDAPLRILILGNSITRHGPCAEIDWHCDWGMAASAAEKDYVHRLYAMLAESGKNVYMMIRQSSHWERNFKSSDCLSEYEKEKAFGADLVVFRLGENVAKSDVADLKEAVKDFISYVAPSGAHVVITTNFWKNTACDFALTEAAKELGCPYVDLSFADESMMALGKFTHHGVAMHPGDEGMEMIATRIFENIRQCI